LAIAKTQHPETIAHYDFSFVKPLDENVLHAIFTEFTTVITVEDGVVKGGFGSAILEFASQNDYTAKIITLGIPDEFIEQGTVAELQQYCKIDVKSLEILFSSY
jgi:1-deoxy-D-xylulose-5-phosphate synthase